MPIKHAYLKKVANVTSEFSFVRTYQSEKYLVLFYFIQRDANVFVVNWGDAAITPNYRQAASDTRVVGAEITK